MIKNLYHIIPTVQLVLISFYCYHYHYCVHITRATHYRTWCTIGAAVVTTCRPALPWIALSTSTYVHYVNCIVCYICVTTSCSYVGYM